MILYLRVKMERTLKQSVKEEMKMKKVNTHLVLQFAPHTLETITRISGLEDRVAVITTDDLYRCRKR